MNNYSSIVGGSAVSASSSSQAAASSSAAHPVFKVQAVEHLNASEMQAAWQQAETCSLGLEDLFPLSPSAADAPNITAASDSCESTLQGALSACYQSPVHKFIEKPGETDRLGIDSAYVRLALVHERHHTEPDAKRHLLILGEAGVGKSVLSQYAAYKWAQTEKGLWGGAKGRFKALFWLKLKELNQDESFENILINRCMGGLSQDKPTAEALRYWLKENVNHILLVLDGYDEVADFASDSTHPLHRFMREALAHPNVLMTSRPYRHHQIAGVPIDHFSCYRNIGFHTEDFPHYIAHYFASQPNKDQLIAGLSAWLKKHPVVNSIARVPLQLGMLCWLWQDAAKENSMPLSEQMTLTMLYQEIIQRLLRKLSLAPTQELKIVQFLNSLAYEGLKANNLSSRYQFTSQTIRQLLQKVFKENSLSGETEQFFFQHLLRLGILKAEKGSTALHQADTFYFTHLTYQEYGAASHLVRLFELSSQHKDAELEIMRLIASHKFHPRYARVWWFTAGILGGRWSQAHKANKTKTPPDPQSLREEAQARQGLMLFFNELQRSARDLLGGYELGLLVRCLEETQLDHQALNEFFPEIIAWLKQSLVLLKKVFQSYPGLGQADLEAHPFVHQLTLSPSIYGLIAPTLLPGTPLRDLWVDSPAPLLSSRDQSSKVTTDPVREPAPSIPEDQTLAMVATLLQKLGHYDWELRLAGERAFQELAPEIPDAQIPAVLATLLEMFKKPIYGMRLELVYALETLALRIPESQLSQPVTALVQMFEHHDKKIRTASIYALERLVDRIPEDQTPTVVTMLLKLEHSDSKFRKFRYFINNCLLDKLAFRIPENQIPAMVATLLQKLEHSDSTARAASVTVLYRIAPRTPKDQIPAMVATLLQKSEHFYSGVRSAAVCALHRLIPCIPEAQLPELVTALVQMLEDSYSEVRSAAVCALGALAPRIPEARLPPQLVTTLVQQLEDINYEVRSAAVFALLHLIPRIPEVQLPQLVTALVQMLEDSYLSVRQPALSALHRLILIPRRLPEAQLPPVVTALLKSLKDSEAWVREAGMTVLCTLAPCIPEAQLPAVVAALAQKLKDPNDSVQWESARVLGFFAAHLDFSTQLTAMLILAADVEKVKKSPNDLYESLRAYVNTNPTLLWCCAPRLFDSDDEFRSAIFVQMHKLVTHFGRKSDWRWQYLSALRGELPDASARKAAFADLEKVSLKDLAGFFRLLLSVGKQPALAQAGCFLVTYVCYAHQLVLSVEEPDSPKASASLTLTRQEESVRIVLPEGQLEPILTELQHTFCEDLTSEEARTQVFPTPEMLMRHQRLWGLLRLPTGHGSGKECDSLVLPETNSTKITCDRWVVSIGVSRFGSSFIDSHAFLLIEGVDNYGRGLFLRYDLALDRASLASKRYKVVTQKIFHLQTPEEREQALSKTILKGKARKLVGCVVSREQVVAGLIKALEAEIGKDMTEFYHSLGDSMFSSLRSAAGDGKVGQQKMNCLTWALKHLKTALGDEKFNTHFAHMEGGIPIPATQVREVNNSRCTIM